MQAKYLGMPPPRETSWEKGKFPLHFCPPWQLEGDRRTASPSLWGGWRERRGGRLGVKFLMGWGGGEREQPQGWQRELARPSQHPSRGWRRNRIQAGLCMAGLVKCILSPSLSSMGPEGPPTTI